MKKLMVYLGVFLVLSVSLFVLKQKMQPNLSFYEITCGEGEGEVQYIATEKRDEMYLVTGEYRSFEGCKVILVEPKRQ